MSSLCDRFVFKQKTAYELRISDWSSDVCSSDLSRRERGPGAGGVVVGGGGVQRDAGAGGDLITELEAGQELGAVAARGPVAEGEPCRHHGDAGVPLGHVVTETGRAHVVVPVTNAHLVCRLLFQQKILFCSTFRSILYP